MADHKKLVDRIVKLFNLGGNNPSEVEVMAAVTKAKEMMAEHDISMADVQAALNAKATKHQAPSFDIGSYTAFTRKMRNLAIYDHWVAVATGYLTQTHPILTRRGFAGQMQYISLEFVGTDADAQVASALFMVLLKTVRRRAREEYGHGKNQWTKQHTSYAAGFAGRLIDRAQEMVGTLSATQQQTMALVVQSKQTAIDRYLHHRGVTEGKKNKSKFDMDSYLSGYIDGGSIVLDKKGIH